MPTVAVIGASRDRTKFGNKAVRAHRAAGWDVIPIHPREAEIEGEEVVALEELPRQLDRITLYVAPTVGEALLEAIASREPMELFLNPGTSSATLLSRARQLGLAVKSGCAIRDVGEDPADY